MASTDPEKNLAPESAAAATSSVATIPEVEKKENGSESSLHSPVGPADSEHNEEVQHVEPEKAGEESKPLEKQLSKEVLERSKVATGLIMFSLCVSICRNSIANLTKLRWRCFSQHLIQYVASS
jgi:hypothetical protein